MSLFAMFVHMVIGWMQELAKRLPHVTTPTVLAVQIHLQSAGFAETATSSTKRLQDAYLARIQINLIITTKPARVTLAIIFTASVMAQNSVKNVSILVDSARTWIQTVQSASMAFSSTTIPVKYA